MFVPPDHVIDSSEYDSPAINNTRIIHIHRRNRQIRREEGKYNRHKSIYRGDNINRKAPTAKIPGTELDAAAADFLHDEDDDGNEVGGEVGGDGEGDDGVEGCVGADLDEGEKGGNCAC